MLRKIQYTLIILLFVLVNSLNAQNTVSNQNTALVIIDIQNFYFPNGMLPLNEPEKAAENAKLVLNKARGNNVLIVHVKHNASSGSEIHELVKPVEGEKVISKNKANSFAGTDLLDYLKTHNISDVILIGMQTHMCLEATTRAASDFGFNCTVVEDACTTRDLKYDDVTVFAKDVHYSTLASLNKTYAKIISTQEFLDQFTF